MECDLSPTGSKWLRYGLYPLLLAVTAGYAAYALTDPTQLGRYYGVYLLGMVIIMAVIEAVHPLRLQWAMRRGTFFRRDLPFMLIGAASLAAADYAAGRMLLQHQIARPTWLAQLPLWLGVPLGLLAKDFLWYWVHRAYHEAGGKLGERLWKLHVAHHLPQQVYVLMHAVGHPLDGIIARAVSALPLFLLGFSQEAVFLVVVITSFQGLVSHFNVDIRVGWLNFLLVGTELHRFHHSADREEGKNYGAVVPFWDLLFGTFRYAPRRDPAQLGVEQPDAYPSDRAVLRLLALPFRTG